jgi:hypothetical protein
LGKETSDRFKRAKDPKKFEKFKFTNNDYTKRSTTKTPQGTPTRAKEIIINTSPERHSTKSKDELLLSVCGTLRTHLSSVKKKRKFKINKHKRKKRRRRDRHKKR